MKFFIFDNMNLGESIKNKASDFVALCRMHRVKSLYAFGSSTNESFIEDSSDIDLLIELDIDDPLARGENLMLLWDKLEHFFQRKVDLLTSNSIRNPILRNSIDSSKVLIYDGQKQEISI
jgi:hypothetical protein